MSSLALASLLRSSGKLQHNSHTRVCVQLLLLQAYPLDLVRTRLAAQTQGTYYSGIGPTLRCIVADEGVGGLYRGLGATLLQVSDRPRGCGYVEGCRHSTKQPVPSGWVGACVLARWLGLCPSVRLSLWDALRMVLACGASAGSWQQGSGSLPQWACCTQCTQFILLPRCAGCLCVTDACAFVCYHS